MSSTVQLYCQVAKHSLREIKELTFQHDSVLRCSKASQSFRLLGSKLPVWSHKIHSLVGSTFHFRSQGFQVPFLLSCWIDIFFLRFLLLIVLQLGKKFNVEDLEIQYYANFFYGLESLLKAFPVLLASYVQFIHLHHRLNLFLAFPIERLHVLL